MLGLSLSVDASIILAKGHGLIFERYGALCIPTFYADSIEGVTLAPRLPMNCAARLTMKARQLDRPDLTTCSPPSSCRDFILMYQSIPSLTIPPSSDPRGFAHSSCPGVGFSLLCLARGVAPGIFNQSKSSIIFKKRNFCFVS